MVPKEVLRRFRRGKFLLSGMYNIKRLTGFASAIFAGVFLILAGPAQAAVNIVAPPIDAIFEDETAGGGSYIPLMKFQLNQSSGSDTLSSVRIAIYSTTTPNNLTTGEINKLYLFKESGAHFEFQPGEDTQVNTGVNEVTDPATSTAITITVDADKSTVGTSPTEYYIVGRATSSSATAAGRITNGHAFYATTSANWLTTSAVSLGNEFIGQRKITLVQSAALKISEVRLGTTGNAGDEFIELFNTSEFAVDLSLLPLSVYIFNPAGGAGLKSLIYFKKIIPAEGFFLIASETNYSGATPPDAVYTTLSGNTLISDTGFSIATSSAVANATSSDIDRIAWGAEPAANAEGTALADLAADRSYERKASTTSTNATMAPGGIDAGKGNGHDADANSTDFVEQTGGGVNPQNSSSPHEFSFGGGEIDSEKPFVGGSYPGPNQTGVPVDMPFIGFGFNKVVATGTIISASATSTVTLTAQGSGTNLCTSVSYNPFPSNFEPPAKCNLSAQLLTSTTYTFTVATSIADLSGNALDQDSFLPGNQAHQFTFSTGGAGQTITNTIPPAVVGTNPFSGGINIPTNIAKISVKFSQSTMDVSTLNSSTITLSGATLSNFSFDATTSLLSITPSSLSANISYTLTVNTGVKNQNGIFLPGPYISTFTTGSGADYTAPNVSGVMPTPGTTLPLNAVDFVFFTDDHLDPSTATSTAVTLSFGGSNLPGAVSYDSVAKEGHFTATNPLPAGAVNNLVLTLVGGALKNITGSTTAAIVRAWSTEGSNSDAIGPTVLFANSDPFGLAVTFNEAVKETDAEALANYSLTVGGASLPLSSFAGHTISYDVSRRTSKISGVFLSPGAVFNISASNIRDISGNAMSGSSAATSTVMTGAASGGFLGPGESTGNYGPDIKDFSASGIGFMPGVRVMPMNAFISASTTYGFELPLSKQISANGTIVITFPSSSDFGVCCVATSSASNPFISEQNKDINGPGTGLVGIKSITKDTTAKTITLTLDTATRSELGDTHDFLRLALNDIKNPSVPKGIDSSGYALDIKTKSSAGALLETFTSNPIFVSGGAAGGSATTTIQGRISGNGDNLAGVSVRIMSPQIGMLESTTDANGDYQFLNVSVNDQISSFGGAGAEYFFFTDPFVDPTSTTTDFFGEPQPIPIRATSTSIVTQNLTLTPTTQAVNFTVKITGDNSTNAIFKVGEAVDVFAGGPSKFVVKTIGTSATDYSATTLTVMPISKTNGIWGIGIGPAMPKGMGSMNFGPPPSPLWVVPKPVEVEVTGCPDACTSTINGSTATSYTFTVSVANRSITGILKDGSGNVISGAEVFAFSPAAGIGNHIQTAPSGVFTVLVTDGSFNVGAFIPGIGSSSEIPVTVSASGVFVNGSTTASTGATGANPFILTIKKPSFTITGRVSDGSSAVSNAPVFSYRTDGPGHADAVSDSSGNYTLYVDNGTWKVNAFVPGFGPAGEQTATISGSSKSGVNFSPSTSVTFRTLTGIVFESANAEIATSTEGVSGVVVRVSGANGTNEALTGSDGTFTIRVPSGAYNIVDIFKPGYGRIPPLNHALTAIGTIDASSGNVYQPIRINSRSTITITVKDSSDAALTVSKAYIDLFDANKNFGNHAVITNGTTTTIQISQGASSTVRAFVEGVPQANVSVASDAGAGTLVLSGVLEVNAATEAIKIVVNTNTAALHSVSGTVYAGSVAAGNELADAWVQFVDSSNNVHFGTQATSSGIYSLRVASSTYQVAAMKPGYISTPVSVIINAATSSTHIVVTQAGSSIKGSITSGGSPATEAFVWAEKLGGGFAASRTDTSGVYTLTVDSGQWKVFAVAEGYTKTAYSSNPVSAGASGINIALTSLASSISSTLVTSNTFSDNSSGILSDSTLGVKVALDSGALGSAGTNAYVTAKETSNVPETLDTNIVGDKGIDIDAINGSSAVTKLQTGKSAEITMNYTKTELATDGIDTTDEVAALKVVSWSDDKKSWESLTTVATYKDADGNPVATPTSNLSNVTSVDFTTVGASHFSEYALSSPTNSDAPATPSGFAASDNGGTTATLSWTANTEGDLSGYFIYRDTTEAGSFPQLTQLGAVTTYSNSGLTAGQTYYYKISAFDTDNNESAASAVKSVIIPSSASGSSGGSSGSSGGSASSASTPVTATVSTPTLVTTTPTPSTAVSVPASVVAQPSPVAVAVSPVFNADLEPGMRGEDVRRLQELLARDPEIYPEGMVSGYYGPLTAQAVRRFQAKHGLLTVGRVGPLTREKMGKAFGQSVPASEVAQPSPVAVAVSPVFNADLEPGMRGEDVRRLQELLARDPEIYPEGMVSGYYGPLTAQAVRRFQAKHGLPSPGRLGPQTRAKIQKAFSASLPSAPLVSPDERIRELQEKLRLLQEQVQNLLR